MASATSSISLDVDFLPPEDLQPHAPPSTEADIIAPWLVPGSPVETEKEVVSVPVPCFVLPAVLRTPLCAY